MSSMLSLKKLRMMRKSEFEYLYPMEGEVSGQARLL